jgi:hypothetical protein
LSERTNSYNLGTGAERLLGCGFGSIEYLRESGAILGSSSKMQW